MLFSTHCSSCPFARDALPKQPYAQPPPSTPQSAYIVTFSWEPPLTTEINTATCLLIAVPHLLSFLDFFYLLFS